MSRFFANVGEKDYINITQKTAIWDFLEEYLKPSGWVVSLARRSKIIPDAPLLIDCGAISYRKAEIPYIRGEQVNPSWVINQAKLIANAGDIICAPDHLLLPESNLKFRRKFNQENAVNFLELAKQELASGIIPMAVVHGMLVEERIEYARWLYKIGYRCIGIGGLVPLASNTKYCKTVVREIRKSLPYDCQLHVLGLSSPAYAATWNELGIDSFDGRTYQLEAIQGEIYETVGCTIKRHRIARIGEEIAAPLCYCPVCVRLRKEGLDSRISGTRLSTLALIAHNLGQYIAAQRNMVTKCSITLISCVNGKQSSAAPAAELYNSPWWKTALQFAEMTGANWYALSARHGIVHPDSILEPYNETLKGQPIAKRRQWSKMVVEQLEEIAHPKGAEIVFIGGKRYREFVIPQLLSIPDKLYTTRAPLAGLGIGYQMQWLKQKTPKYKHLQLALL